jgi:hypothetical protein
MFISLLKAVVIDVSRRRTSHRHLSALAMPLFDLEDVRCSMLYKKGGTYNHSTN